MSKEIRLNKGAIAIVDDEDFEKISQFRWWLTSNGYAYRQCVDKSGKRYNIQMHREIMEFPDDKFVDHINHNKLDNRRQNLRLANKTQSICNTGPRNGKQSPFKGVSFNRFKWGASIMLDSKSYFLGGYATQREAAIAYNEAAVRFFGEFAYLNDISIFNDETDPPIVGRKRTTKFRGVTFLPHVKERHWKAFINVNNKRIHLGTYVTEEEAAIAYDAYVIEHGLQRPINFPSTLHL